MGLGNGALSDYQSVLASTSSVFKGTRATGAGAGAGNQGDIIDGVLFIPTSTTVGAVTIQDGSNTAITILSAGTLSDLKPFLLDTCMKSTNGGWNIVVGAGVNVLVYGRAQ